MIKWNLINIETRLDANNLVKKINEVEPEIGAFDTETTGLHIILDKPFVIQFGFINKEQTEGWAYVVDLENYYEISTICLKYWFNYAKKLKINLGHNVKFDMHMLTNINIKFPKHNLSDTMFYIRYAHDALTAANGGPRLGLKEYTEKYIDYNAKVHDTALKREQTAIASNYKNMLKDRLQKIGISRLSDIENYFKDVIFSYKYLPPEIKKVYIQWIKEDLPDYLQTIAKFRLIESTDIRYDKLNRKNLCTYAGYDIVYTLETYLNTKDMIKFRENEFAIEVENSVIEPLFEMERVGFLIDENYLEESRKKLKNYILEKRKLLHSLINREIKINQHALIKKISDEYFDFELASTSAKLVNEELVKLKKNTEQYSELILFLETIQELRSLEKWYSVYITRFQLQLSRGYPRLHTQINQVGAVSGRVTSDFQQFPREGIFDSNGTLLYHPRRLVIAPPNHRLVYMDYSQIELRIQALYTYLVGNPDRNMMRAYMPWDCEQKDNKYYLKEDSTKEWKPTDLHGASAKEAFGIDESHPDWKHYRSAAKTYNFMKNYGGGISQTAAMFYDRTPEEIKHIDGAYYRAFPGVKTFHNYCYRLATEKPYAMNLFGVKYYGLSGHKIINILGQGSAAFLLKLKIREVFDMTKKLGIKARFQMNIHDEMSWEDLDTTYEQFYEIKKVMENWEACIIPIVAEMAISNKTWADKVDIHTKEEFYDCISD